jgi:hypothetical protein
LAAAAGGAVSTPNAYTLVGTIGTATTSVSNNGDGNLSGLGAISNLNGTLSSGAGEFSLVGPAAVSIPDHTTINPVYNYAPTARGVDVENLTHSFTNGNPSGDNTAVNLGITVTGEGVAPVQVTSHVDAPLTRITYLTPGPGSTNPPKITVLNNGDGNLSGLGAISNLNGSIDGGTDARFTGGGAAFSLNDNGTVDYAITYKPTTHTIDSSTFTINYTNGSDDNTNQAQVVQVQVDGQGVGPIFDAQVYDTTNSPVPGNTLDFGDVVIGGNGQLQLDISNITTDPNGGDSTLTDLTLLSYTITGPDAVEFSLPGFVPGTVLNAGDLISYLVNFDPLFPPGIKTATLTFLTDQDAVFGQAGQSFSFNLVGLAAPEPASVLGFALCTIGGVVAYRLRRRR